MSKQTYRSKKEQTILNIKDGVEVRDIPKHLAQKTLADCSDENIRKLVEDSIREFACANIQDGVSNKNFSLEDLHKVLSVDLIPKCQDHVNRKLQMDMMKWAYHIGVERLGFRGNFYIDKEIYLRINYPFEVASLGVKSSVTNPDHRLTKYNKGRPRATWGHGPHKDSWYGHSHSAINLWFSVCGTNEQATMTMFPDHAYSDTAYDPESMYASYSENLGKHVKLELSKGENFIFDPELLHSTRVNTSNQTRIVLTLRTSESEPLFSSTINHDVYDQWLTSDSILEGKLNPKKVGKKVEIGDYPSTTTDVSHYKHKINQPINFDSTKLNRDDFAVKDGVVFELICSDKECLGLFFEGRLHRFSKYCPHVGAPMLGGYFTPESLTLKCPAHGAEFCLKDGSSGSKNLKLSTFNESQSAKELDAEEK